MHWQLPPDELLELEELEELDELLLDELLLEELDELEEELELLEELEELDELLPDPTQVGRARLPSELPWKPKLAVCPEPRLPFQLRLDALTLLPEVLNCAFQPLVYCGLSANTTLTDQLLTAEPLLVTLTSA